MIQTIYILIYIDYCSSRTNAEIQHDQSTGFNKNKYKQGNRSPSFNETKTVRFLVSGERVHYLIEFKESIRLRPIGQIHSMNISGDT